MVFLLLKSMDFKVVLTTRTIQSLMLAMVMQVHVKIKCHVQVPFLQIKTHQALTWAAVLVRFTTKKTPTTFAITPISTGCLPTSSPWCKFLMQSQLMEVYGLLCSVEPSSMVAIYLVKSTLAMVPLDFLLSLLMVKLIWLPTMKFSLAKFQALAVVKKINAIQHFFE